MKIWQFDGHCFPLVFLRCAVGLREVLCWIVQDALIRGAAPFACVVGKLFDKWAVNQNIGKRENLWDVDICSLLQFFQREARVQCDMLPLRFEQLQ